jgi:hypothetical protein
MQTDRPRHPTTRTGEAHLVIRVESVWNDKLRTSAWTEGVLIIWQLISVGVGVVGESTFLGNQLCTKARAR